MIDRLARWLLPAVGVLVLALALAPLVGVDLAPLERLANDLVVLAGAGVVALLAVLVHVGRRRAGPPTGSARTDSEPPTEFSEPAPAERATESWALTDPIDALLEPPPIDETTFERRARGKARNRTRNRARALVVELLADRADLSHEDAGRLVLEGTWTDDPRAASFVGYGRIPLRIRLIDWLLGARYRRGLEATLDELERLEAASVVDLDVEGRRDGQSSRGEDRSNRERSGDGPNREQGGDGGERARPADRPAREVES